MNVAGKNIVPKRFHLVPENRTDRFPDSFNFHENIALFYNHETFGPYARELIEGDGFRKPPGGHRDDKAHPPIYPSKLATMHEYNSWDREGQQVYDFVFEALLGNVFETGGWV